jgi:hypothetical protein
MLVTNCEGFGQFASAFHQGKATLSPQLEKSFNWEKVNNKNIIKLNSYAFFKEI